MMKWISFPGWFGKSPEKMVSGGRRTKTISNALPHWCSRGGDDTESDFDFLIQYYDGKEAVGGLNKK